MPSPPIPPSSSTPFLSSSSSPSSSKNPHFHHSNRSSFSAGRSYKSPYWLAWSNINKLGRLLIPERRSPDSSSRHSDLTEESLEAHNRRHAEATGALISFRTTHHQNHHYITNMINVVDDKNARCSPYYKGLTDASLTINRERLLPSSGMLPPPSSPGRESHATTVATATSLSSFLLKMQEWSACFSFSSSSFKSYTSKMELAGKDLIHQDHEYTHKSSNDNILVSATTTHINYHCTSTASSSSLANDALMVVSTEQEKSLRESIQQQAESSSIPPPQSSTTANTTTTTKSEAEKPLRERVSPSADQSNPDGDQNNTTAPDPPAETSISTGSSAGEFMWANKYRPKALKDFICNRSTALRLKDQIRGEHIIDCMHDHFIFEGSAGVGKRTMISAMLQEAFGPDQPLQTWEECKTFSLKYETVGSIQVRMKLSSQHVEVNLSDLKGYEKYVIMELIKQTPHITNNASSCRAIVLYDADKLSTDVVLYIKWLLERYKGLCKFFFCCTDVSKLEPIMTLCTHLYLSPPSNQEVVEVLKFIAEKEGIELPDVMAEKIADNSKNNLRQAIRSFEASWRKNYPFITTTQQDDDDYDQVIWNGWEDDIANIARDMIQEQSPKQLYIIRGKLQNLIEYDVSPDFIFESLVAELRKHLGEPFQPQLNSLYKDYGKNDGINRSDYEDQLFFSRSRHEDVGNDPTRKRVHQFMKIEEFIAKFMSCYKLSVASKARDKVMDGDDI